MCEVKENQDQYHIFLYLKENVHKQRVLSFEQGEDSVAKVQGILCLPKVDGLKERILGRLIAPNTPFTGFEKDVLRFKKGILVRRHENDIAKFVATHEGCFEVW